MKRHYKNLIKLAIYWKTCNDLLAHTFCFDDPSSEDFTDAGNADIAIGAASIAFGAKISSEELLSIRKVASYLTQTTGLDDLMLTFDDVNTEGDTWLVSLIGDGELTVTNGDLRYTNKRLGVCVEPTHRELRTIVSFMVYNIFDGEAHSHHTIVDYVVYDLKRNVETKRDCSVKQMVTQILNDGMEI